MGTGDLDRPIGDIVPHIFKRPILYVRPSDPMLQVATYLAIGPQIYVDGITVLNGETAVGRIGGTHVIQHILLRPNNWLESVASEIMSKPAHVVSAEDELSTALEVFAKTKFAYVPVAIDGKVGTTLCIRDILPQVANDLTSQAAEFSSPLISVSANTSLKQGLGIMLNNGVRNLALVSEEGMTKIANDRIVLEFLASHEGRRAAASKNGLESVAFDQLDLQVPKAVNRNITLQTAAEYLSHVSAPCLLLPENRILTPWDIVMKGKRI